MAIYSRGNIGLFFRGDPSLVSYVPLRGNFIDFARNLNGTASNITWRSNKLFPFKEQVGFFNGFSSKVILPPPSQTFNSISLLAWAQRLGDAYTWDGKIIDLKGPSNRTTIAVDNPGNPNKFHFAIFTTTGNYIVIYGADQFYNRKIFFIAGVYDGSTAKLYVNGNLVASVNASGVLTVNSYYYIGQEAGDIAPRYFNGIITECAVFSRALSPQEIKSYYKWATGQKKVLSLSKIFFFSESSFLISGQTISQIKTQNSTTFSLSVSESNKLKTFPSSSIQFLTTANSKREIPKQLIKDIKTEKINFDITNQP